MVCFTNNDTSSLAQADKNFSHFFSFSVAKPATKQPNLWILSTSAHACQVYVEICSREICFQVCLYEQRLCLKKCYNI